MNNDISNPSPLFEKIAQLIEQARQRVAKFTNLHTLMRIENPDERRVQATMSRE